MGWLLAVGLAVMVLVFWQALVAWWEQERRPESRFLLLMLLIRDQAETVEGFLRAVVRHLTWFPPAGTWDVMVLDTGSGDETPAIARRLLARAGITFVAAGGEWCRVVEEVACRGQPVLLVPLVREGDVHLLLPGLSTILGGKSRIPVDAGELHNKCKMRS